MENWSSNPAGYHGVTVSRKEIFYYSRQNLHLHRRRNAFLVIQMLRHCRPLQVIISVSWKDKLTGVNTIIASGSERDKNSESRWQIPLQTSPNGEA